MEKKRVVAYVRVSSKSSAQLHSYEFQERYWQDKFADDPQRELVGFYADRGISGSSVKKRTEFLRMMDDARSGRFDQIQTKSVSRFARNTVELLEAVRELRDLGIEVFFENEQISSMEPTSELYLTIAATVAENDLAVDSDRQHWSMQHRFENGWICIGSGMYGYRMTEGNRLVIAPEEAEVVRRIYDMYISGYGAQAIANVLNAEGIVNARGGIWRSNTLLKLISNEKYMGDSIMGKVVQKQGVKFDNSDGQFGERYYIENSHESIVSRDVWQRAQDIRQQRKNPKLVGQQNTVYPFTGLIECGKCHAHFRHKINSSGQKWASPIWMCSTQYINGKAACDCTRIKDSVLKEKFVEAYNEFVTARPQSSSVIAMQEIIDKLQKEEADLAALALKHLLPVSTLHSEQRRIRARIRELRQQIAEQSTVSDSDYTPITEFSEEKLKKFIKKVIVSDGTVAFLFYNGITIRKEYSNGQPGNKPGWKQRKEG